MSLDHKNVTRINDEYVCTHCGKSWDVNDQEPPACEFTSEAARPAYVRRRYHGTISSGPVPHMHNLPKVVSGRTSAATESQSNRPKLGTYDLSKIEEHVLSAMTAKYGYPFDHGREDFGAYIVSFRGLATLIYAGHMTECVSFFGKIAKQMCGGSTGSVNDMVLSFAFTDMRFERAKSLDCYCTGRTPRVEMNPSVLAKASTEHTNSGNQYPVTNIIGFTNHIAGALK